MCLFFDLVINNTTSPIAKSGMIKKKGFLNHSGAPFKNEKAAPRFFAYTMLKNFGITMIVWYRVMVLETNSFVIRSRIIVATTINDDKVTIL